MARGELYVKTRFTADWVDAWDRYGLSLEKDGGLPKLMTPAPNKAPTGNSNVVTPGVAYLSGSIGVKDERSLTVEMHVTAPDRETFLTRFGQLCAEVFDAGYVQLRTCYLPGVVFHLIYLDCQQFREWDRRLAKFMVSFTEPHPEVRR